MRGWPWPARILTATLIALVAAAVAVAVPTPAAQAATFTAGLTSITGTTDDWANQNGMSATQVAAGATGGGLTKVSLYIGAVNAAPSNHGQVAVYSDVNDLPGAKLAASGSQVLTKNAWNNFPLTGVSVAPNAKYWLVFNVDGGNTKYKIKPGGRDAWKIPTTFGTWPSPFGTPNPPAATSQYAINMTWDGTATTTPPTSTTTTATTTTTPPPSGFPDGSNTGVPAGTALTDYTGPCLITAADTVIDSKTINCTLVVHAANLQVTKSRINGQVWLDADLAGGETWSASVTDSEVDAGAVDLPGICCANLTILRTNMHGGHNGAQCDGTGNAAKDAGLRCSITDSWIHGQYQGPGDAHLGGFLTDGGIGSGITLAHNTVACDSPGGGCTGDINLIPNFGVVTKVTVQNNLLVQNNQAAYCTYGGEKPGSPFPNADHVVYQDNVFERGPNNQCAGYGPVTNFNTAGVGNQWINNTWSDGGAVSPN